MDVTSLLNGESIVAEEKRIERPKIHGRSRTPWDAGGYALPITTRQPTSPPPQQQPPQSFHFDDEQLVSPTSPKHRFSDSRSSFSSLVSSIPSTTHSRFSSFSTVSSPHPLNAVAAEYFSPKSSAIELPCSSLLPEGLNHELHTPATPSANHFDVLGPIAENGLSPPLEAQVQEEHDEKNTGRPGSPSDAILIKRTMVPTLRLDTSNHHIIRSAQHPPNVKDVCEDVKNSKTSSAPVILEVSAADPGYPTPAMRALRERIVHLS
ncbi:uncharacterized protein BP5553_05012 [Venustampulla echinocandica]|uniref:Uncharacterized protein n=1 Tax=Venustampulla echinocandica TaxID=2656787 RepID=A0A370TPX6_9HELO|nr:uncharacterized protein BP5553_05012 [Venustampulla echinocandica]RDL37579.1 hypothetical protein BP5553_05012 [Venustampulla echinocandica]